jgi:hypothetical protein
MEVKRVTGSEYRAMKKMGKEPVEVKKPPETMLTWGWILLTIFLPLAGVFIGIWGINREDKEGGGALIFISLAATFFWIVVLS